MNATRRSQIDKAVALLDEAYKILDAATAAEQQELDELREREGEDRGDDAIESAIAQLEDAAHLTDDAAAAAKHAKGDA